MLGNLPKTIRKWVTESAPSASLFIWILCLLWSPCLTVLGCSEADTLGSPKVPPARIFPEAGAWKHCQSRSTWSWDLLCYKTHTAAKWHLRVTASSLEGFLGWLIEECRQNVNTEPGTLKVRSPLPTRDLSLGDSYCKWTTESHAPFFVLLRVQENNLYTQIWPGPRSKERKFSCWGVSQIFL